MNDLEKPTRDWYELSPRAYCKGYPAIINGEFVDPESVEQIFELAIYTNDICLIQYILSRNILTSIYIDKSLYISIRACRYDIFIILFKICKEREDEGIFKTIELGIFYCIHEDKCDMLRQLFKLFQPTLEMLNVAAYHQYINVMKLILSLTTFSLNQITKQWSIPHDIDLVLMAIEHNVQPLLLNCCAHTAAKMKQNTILRTIYEKTKISSDIYHTNRIAITCVKYDNQEGLFIVLTNTNNMADNVINWINAGGKRDHNFYNDNVIQFAYSDI